MYHYVCTANHSILLIGAEHCRGESEVRIIWKIESD
jgi:hypothetical protein